MSHIHSIISNTLVLVHVPTKTTKFDHHAHFSPSPLIQLNSTKLLKINNNNNNNKRRRSLIVLGAASSPSVEITDDDNAAAGQLMSGSEVVRRFYAGINGGDIGAVENLIAENCVYEDLIFPRPFVGRKTIIEFFGKFIDVTSNDLQFVIDAISEEDSSAVGVTWHLEWKGKVFPFSKGCSFYQLVVVNGSRQIIYARDSVEPAIKPGETALVAIRGVTWLLQRFPSLVDRL
ncbi:hypothetical protein vseg_002897 [Gypsophila vaccaria]